MNLRERRGLAKFLIDAKFRRQVVGKAHEKGIGKSLGSGAVDVKEWLKILSKIIDIILSLL